MQNVTLENTLKKQTLWTQTLFCFQSRLPLRFVRDDDETHIPTNQLRFGGFRKPLPSPIHITNPDASTCAFVCLSVFKTKISHRGVGALKFTISVVHCAWKWFSKVTVWDSRLCTKETLFGNVQNPLLPTNSSCIHQTCTASENLQRRRDRVVGSLTHSMWWMLLDGCWCCCLHATEGRTSKPVIKLWSKKEFFGLYSASSSSLAILVP